jgi:hypothetical protein
MTFALGLEAPLSFSVFSASARPNTFTRGFQRHLLSWRAAALAHAK